MPAREGFARVAESTQQGTTALTPAEEKLLAHSLKTDVSSTSTFWAVFGFIIAAGACFILAGATAVVDLFREQPMFDGVPRDMFWLGMFLVFGAYQIRSQLRLVRIIQYMAPRGTSS